MLRCLVFVFVLQVSGPAQDLLELSRSYASKRDFDQAINTAQQYLQQKPDSVPGRLVLANAYFLAQRIPEAKALAEDVLRSDPSQATALKIKGNAQYLLGEVSAAINTFIDLLERQPSDEEGPYMLGRIYYQESILGQAIGQFERALKLNAYSYKAYDGLGLCYEAKGDNKKAAGYFLTAIKLVDKGHPEYDSAYADMAELLLRTGDAATAFGAASKAADRNPYSARNFYLGAKALEQLGRVDLCLNWAERSAALDPNYPEPEYLLARVYRRLGQKDKADEAQKKYIEARAKTSDSRK